MERLVNQMNKTLFFSNIKLNWGVFAFISGMLLIYVITSITMFDPESAEAMMAMFDMLPEGMMKAFGFEGLGTDLTGYLAGYLYGFILLIFPMIYTIMLSYKLVSKHVDSGSMVYLLTTPNTRVQIIFTQAMYLIVSTIVLIIIQALVLIILAENMFPGLLEISKLLSLTLLTYLVLIVVGGISFLFSCIFEDTKYAIGFGAGIPIVLFLIKMISEISDKLSFLKYFTAYSLVVPEKILIDGTYTTVVCLSLVAAAVLLYGSAIYIFNKRSLAL